MNERIYASWLGSRVLDTSEYWTELLPLAAEEFDKLDACTGRPAYYREGDPTRRWPASHNYQVIRVTFDDLGNEVEKEHIK